MGHKASGAQVLFENTAAKQNAKSLIWLGLISKLKTKSKIWLRANLKEKIGLPAPNASYPRPLGVNQFPWRKLDVYGLFFYICTYKHYCYGCKIDSKIG